MSKNGWFNNIARLIKKKDGKFFVTFERNKDKDGKYIGESPYPIVINEGDKFQAKLKRDDLAGLVASGKMSKETVEKICENVKFEFSIPPKSDNEKIDNKPVAKKTSSDGMDF